MKGTSYLAEKLEICNLSPAALHLTAHQGCFFLSNYCRVSDTLSTVRFPCLSVFFFWCHGSKFCALETSHCLLLTWMCRNTINILVQVLLEGRHCDVSATECGPNRLEQCEKLVDLLLFVVQHIESKF